MRKARLHLNRQTIRPLTMAQLGRAGGGTLIAGGETENGNAPATKLLQTCSGDPTAFSCAKC